MIKRILAICILGLTVIGFAHANEYTSTNFKVSAPVIFPGGYGSSSSFGLSGVITQFSIGTSTSSLFGDNAGFLYYPYVTTPAVSATPGNAQVSLSWTSASGYVGWSVSGYNVGLSTISGGPYTFTNVGNILAHTATSLTNSTQYYFIVQAKDALGNVIATSTQISATPTTSTPPSGGGGGGGGGGGSPTAGDTGVIFSGRAYPLSKVTILKDGQVVLTTIAGPDSNFTASLTDLSSGNYTFALYGEDKKGVRSSQFSFPIYITSGVVTTVGGIFIAPTLSLDKEQVKKGDTITVFGQSAPTSDITININSEPEFFVKQKSDTSGAYLLNFDSSVLDLGNHTARSKAILGNEISLFSNTAGFIVGTKNVYASTSTTAYFLKGDLNKDGKVNLVDFSIAAFWYRKVLTDKILPIEKERLNGDKKIDLIDFSIMAYNWTG